MKRRIIKQGNNTLTITLPKKWTEKFGIKAGDEIEVEEKENTLCVQTKSGQQQEEKELDISNFSILIQRMIHALYKKGYDKLKLNYDDPEIFSIIQKSLGNETIGYEIVKHGTNYCEIENISGVLESEFDNVLRKIFLNLVSLAEDSLDTINKNNIDHLKNLIKMEETNNRLTTFCRRCINKHSFKKYTKITFIYCIVEELEKAADEYKYLLSYLIEKNNLKLSKETLNLYNDVNGIVRGFYELFYNFNEKKAVDIAKKRKVIIKEAYALFEKKGSHETIVLHHLIILTQEIFNLLGPLMAMKL